jgi:D-sedoheptulose 7-phosphate isomerase
MNEIIGALFEESIETKQRSRILVDAVAASARMLIDALNHGHKVLVCGNGGSAADAQHFAGELIGRFEKERAGLPCVALTTDSSILTAWSNDYSYDTVFARQVAALGSRGDMLVGISTSGNSTNVLEAMVQAGKMGMGRIALTGRGGGKLKAMTDVCSIVVPSDVTSRIQEVHITIIHIWSRLIEDACR